MWTAHASHAVRSVPDLHPVHAQDEVTFKKQQAAELAATRKRVLVLFHAWVQVRQPPGTAITNSWPPPCRSIPGHHRHGTYSPSKSP